jgi:hypothetical protein
MILCHSSGANTGSNKRRRRYCRDAAAEDFLSPAAHFDIAVPSEILKRVSNLSRTRNEIASVLARWCIAMFHAKSLGIALRLTCQIRSGLGIDGDDGG